MITGRRTAPAPVYYRNIETGRDYWHIAGGIGWPGGGRPGFGIIVGVEKSNDEKPAIYVLAETECQDVGELICRCVSLGKKFGRGICAGVDLFWGDWMRFSSFVTDYNRGKEQFEKLNIANPIGFELPNRFEIYAQRIRAGLGQEKRLFLGECKKLRAYIQNLPPEATETDSPAVFCLGGVMIL